MIKAVKEREKLKKSVRGRHFIFWSLTGGALIIILAFLMY